VSGQFKNIVAILEKISDADNEQSIFNIVDSYGKSLGFSMSILAVCGRLLIKSESVPPYMTSASQAWIDRYMQLELYSVDPVTHMVMRTSRPFTFAEAYRDSTPKVDNYKKEAAAHGFEFGWAVPIHKYGMAPGVASFAGDKKIDLSSTEIVKLGMISMLAYDRASEFFVKSIPEIELKISDRERAVLTLVARGKTNWEIGTMLSISEYSVRDYLKGLSVKLRTSNRAHSVARAMQLGLLVP